MQEIVYVCTWKANLDDTFHIHYYLKKIGYICMSHLCVCQPLGNICLVGEFKQLIDTVCSCESRKDQIMLYLKLSQGKNLLNRLYSMLEMAQTV